MTRETDRSGTRPRVTWTCEISGPGRHADLPEGADSPMRRGIRAAFRDVVGADADHLSSGWSRVAAAPVTGLDVERLARALETWDDGWTRTVWPQAAPFIAAEYARLQEGSTE